MVNFEAVVRFESELEIIFFHIGLIEIDLNLPPIFPGFYQHGNELLEEELSKVNSSVLLTVLIQTGVKILNNNVG